MAPTGGIPQLPEAPAGVGTDVLRKHVHPRWFQRSTHARCGATLLLELATEVANAYLRRPEHFRVGVAARIQGYPLRISRRPG